jgi:hypothetical protein
MKPGNHKALGGGLILFDAPRMFFGAMKYVHP